MTRTVAQRASILFLIATALFAAIGLSSYAPAAEALFLIGAPLCAVLLFFGFATPSHQMVPVRVRRTRRPR